MSKLEAIDLFFANEELVLKITKDKMIYAENILRGYIKMNDDEKGKIIVKLSDTIKEKDDLIKSLEGRLESARVHVEELLSSKDDDCRFDHNNSCQNHGYFYLKDEDCPVNQARQWLKNQDKDE